MILYWPDQPSKDVFLLTGDWSYCSATNQCDAGQGDCDSDTHCKGDLTCGSNNCTPPFEEGCDCCK